MSNTPEQVQEAVASLLGRKGNHMDHSSFADLESLVATLVKQQENKGLSEQELKQLIEESGVIDTLADRLFHTLQTHSTDDVLQVLLSPSSPPLKSTESQPISQVQDSGLKQEISHFGPSYLSLTLHKGKAFLGLPELDQNIHSSLQVSCLWRQDRFESHRVMSCTEPVFNQHVQFELPSKDVDQLLALRDPLHMIVTRIDGSGQRSLVGTRTILCHGRISKSIDLRDPIDAQLTAGLLDVTMELLPKPRHTKSSIQDTTGLLIVEQVEYQLHQELKLVQEYDRMFFSYAKRWWNDYIQMRPQLHQQRLVKLFAQVEGGGGLGVCQVDKEEGGFGARKEPVTSFVYPLICPLLETPKKAARCVALIPHQPSSPMGDTRQDVWFDLHTFLTLGKGDVYQHAILLCNLLLGFSLEAFITCGVDRQSSGTMWVTSIDADDSITFWDPLTGYRYRRPRVGKIGLDKENKKRVEYPFRTVGCCFNDKHFFANIQVSDSVEYCDFDFSVAEHWKPMSQEAILAVKRTPISSVFPFQPFASPLQGVLPSATCQDMEYALRQRITAYRQDHGFISNTLWDDHIRHLLDQVVWEYELAKIWQGNHCKGMKSTSDMGDYFQAGIQTLIPDGHVFKGYPVCFPYQDVDRIFSALLKLAACQDIFMTRGDKVRFGLVVRKFPYMETICAHWVMLAVRFRPLK